MAVLGDMGIAGQGDEILQPMLKNRFRVEFNGMGNAEYLTLQVITADRPKLEFEEIVLDRYNSRAYIAGKHSFQTVNVVFESDIGGGVLSAIQDQLEYQQRLIGMESKILMPASRSGGRYKFRTKIIQLDGDDNAFETWYLEGCFLQNVDWGDLDYSASETLKITATIRYDLARQEINGTKESAVTGVRLPIV